MPFAMGGTRELFAIMADPCGASDLPWHLLARIVLPDPREPASPAPEPLNCAGNDGWRDSRFGHVARGLAAGARPKHCKAAYGALDEEFQLARALIEARTHAGLSQTQLARRMKTSQSYVARIEGGKVRPFTIPDLSD